MHETRYLTVREVLVVYAEIIRASRVRRVDVLNLGGLESALAQPQQTFDGRDLYESIEDKAAALVYSLCQNHPFADGNKRAAFITMRTFLRQNGFDIDVDTHDAEKFMCAIASGEVSTDKASHWIRDRLCRFEFCPGDGD